jgi:hypothetical protein
MLGIRNGVIDEMQQYTRSSRPIFQTRSRFDERSIFYGFYLMHTRWVGMVVHCVTRGESLSRNQGPILAGRMRPDRNSFANAEKWALSANDESCVESGSRRRISIVHQQQRSILSLACKILRDYPIPG